MARKKKQEEGTKQSAVISLTWFARAMEDGCSITDTLVEVYGGQGRLMAADIRELIKRAVRP